MPAKLEGAAKAGFPGLAVVSGTLHEVSCLKSESRLYMSAVGVQWLLFDDVVVTVTATVQDDRRRR